jgi:tetratricopeptide (TPR) repeat protein
MTAKRWKQVEDLFHQAADLPSAERDAWLDKACGSDAALKAEVCALLASDEAAPGFVQGKVDGAIAGFHAGQAGLQRRIGPYRLVSVLGRGGMGTVYLAERADDQYQGEVAIKLVRPGMDTEFFLARFRRERQTLARLEHPNIARLLDSGATEDGLPYLVMERVRGAPINQYVREKKLGVEAILQLFLPVCAAVSHAHQHFVVHRDLKPGNILVDENGAPKLLDFGICKLLLHEPAADATATAAPMMTPDYASPEQVSGENVTVASDIYSMGAVLYELHTGVRPHAISRYTPREVERAICETGVRAPALVCAHRGLARRLAGDLDNIVLRAMRREPSRRYASVEQLAGDIRAHLEFRPVAARPDSMGYRARKFTRRNRGAITAAAAIALALSGGIVVSVSQAQVARRNFADARKLANGLIFDVHDKIRDLPGALPARQAIARTSLTYLDRLAASAGHDANLRQELAAGYERIGAALGDVLGSSAGDTTAALATYRKGMSVIAPVAGNQEADRIRVVLLRRIGDVQFYTGHAEDALRSFNEAIGLGTALHDQFPDDRAILMALGDAYGALQRTLRTEGKAERAVETAALEVKLYQDALANRPADHAIRAELAGATSVQGTILHMTNRLEEARQNFVRATAQWDDICRLEPNNMNYTRQRMLAYSHLGEVLGSPDYSNLGDQAGALAAFQEMLAAARKLYEGNPNDRGAMVDYGMSLMRMAGMPGQSAEQRFATYEKAVEALGEVARLSPDNRNNLIQLAALHEQFADFLATNGRLGLAREEYVRGNAMAESNLEATMPAKRIFITTSRSLALDSARRGDSARALEYARKALAVGEKAAAAKDAGTAARTLAARAQAAMGDVCGAVHAVTDARRWREQALARYHEVQNLPGFGDYSRQDMLRVERLLKRE